MSTNYATKAPPLSAILVSLRYLDDGAVALPGRAVELERADRKGDPRRSRPPAPGDLARIRAAAEL